ncbi:MULTISPECIES: hypothetical protein [Pseudomonas]|uniref:hypothetical protein n=1 Tax=Pseudomonas TaxID=286 RepID=UPI0011AED6B9|nr:MULTISPECIES: hypothetical protein [Pseudomonas]
MFHKSLILILILSFSSISYASCNVKEMITMKKEGSGRSIIKENCDEEVDDAPRCNFSRVLSLVFQNKSSYTIDSECGACERPQCDTQAGSCPMRVLPNGMREGDDCFCALPMGSIAGTLSCNN